MLRQETLLDPPPGLAALTGRIVLHLASREGGFLVDLAPAMFVRHRTYTLRENNVTFELPHDGAGGPGLPREAAGWLEALAWKRRDQALERLREAGVPGLPPAADEEPDPRPGLVDMILSGRADHGVLTSYGFHDLDRHGPGGAAGETDRGTAGDVTKG
ncbi:hypothetical protein [Streptomyces sp. CAU 1734]|uniref:hypothetical protein n=1 Tax=Streptomyces sp. CAU 1734 TaxID=3140360 RepID=UPI0032606907